MARVYEYIDVEVPRCKLRYGQTTAEGTCPAVLGVDSDAKCFNTFGTCPVKDSFREADWLTYLYFARATDTLPVDTIAELGSPLGPGGLRPAPVPCIRDISIRAPRVSLGGDLGQRGELRVTLDDFPDPETGPAGDPYLADRDYSDAYARGTFFGKARARRLFQRGRRVLYTRRVEGKDLADAETRTYVLESVDGPDDGGRVTIVAKDALKLASGDRAQAPALSNGYLASGINNSTTSATLAPTGIGDAEYPASGKLAIGGKEIVSFTRSGDALTITRGQLNTTAAAHDAEARVQLVLEFVGEDPAQVIHDLLADYADMAGSALPVADWLIETSTFFGSLVTAYIAEPTPVDRLISELIEQCGLVVWWDATRATVRLQVLRGVPAGAETFGPDNVPGMIQAAEQPDKQLNVVWTYYGQINPLLRLDDPSNFRSSVATIAEDVDPSAPLLLKKIYSRWIITGNRAAAERLNALLLARFQQAPRIVRFPVMRPDAVAAVSEASGYRVTAPFFQDATGAEAAIPVQAVQVAPYADRFEVEAEEMLYTPTSFDAGKIIVDTVVYNWNLRDIYDQIYTAPDGDTTVTLIIQAGAIIGNMSGVPRALDIGDWPGAELLASGEGDWDSATTYGEGDWVWHDDRPYVSLVGGNLDVEPGVDSGWESSWQALVAITIELHGRIQGRGGDGGTGGQGSRAAADGTAGLTALLTRYPVRITGSGEIWGGGGGGGGGGRGTGGNGGGGGGGGQGSVPGSGGGYSHGGGGTPAASSGDDGTADDAGDGGTGGGGSGGGGGDGGAAGAAGSSGAAGSEPGGAGGAGGIAINGDSYVTIVDSPDIQGAQVN